MEDKMLYFMNKLMDEKKKMAADFIREDRASLIAEIGSAIVAEALPDRR